jgi:hypothetical protein
MVTQQVVYAHPESHKLARAGAERPLPTQNASFVHCGSRANRRYQWFRGGRGRGNFPFYPPYDPYAMYPPTTLLLVFGQAPVLFTPAFHTESTTIILSISNRHAPVVSTFLYCHKHNSNNNS